MRDPADAIILLVDDNTNNLGLLEAQIEHGGFRHIDSAMSGDQAIEYLTRHTPDLIILDVMMPGIDGYETTRRIRAIYPDRFIPIVLLSAIVEPEARARGIQVGANDFVSKPYHSGELLARVRSLIETKLLRDELDAERERTLLLYRVSQALSNKHDYQSAMAEIVRLTTDLTRASKGFLVLVDHKGQFLQKILAREGEGVRSTGTIDPTVLHDGLIGWVLKAHEPAYLRDVSTDSRWVHGQHDQDVVHSAIAVPLMRAGQIAGVLMLTSSERDAFDAHHDLLTTIATQASITLENTALYEEAQQQREQAEALFNQTANPVIITDPSGVIVRFNKIAEETLGISDGAIGRRLDVQFNLALADLVLRAQERGAPVSGEYGLRQPGTDERLPFNISVSPIEEVGFMLIWQDITALKENERIRLDMERAETQHVLEVFSRYMSDTLVQRVLSDRDILQRRERRDALVIFADLRGFTRMTVQHNPDDVISVLNDFFDAMMQIVYEQEGVVFDITGDELMVGFNVPFNQPDAPYRALSTAIAMQQHFAHLQLLWANRGIQVGMGIGMNRGPVVLGHIGGRSRMNYAMVGQSVNVAHRLVEMA
ncbi:MAG: response regulator, partial [Anaerolineae bacterium]|nr:response regulator [Anaerolineae bacterium]